LKKIFSFCAIFITALIVLFPQISSQYAKASAETCFNVLIPSIFPFIVCVKLISALGIADRFAKQAGKIMLPLFKINGNGSLPLIMGMLSGYPMGIMMCSQLYSQKKISKNEALRLTMFTNNSGPLFIISAVGIGLFYNVHIGIILYISHILAALTVGFLCRFFAEDNSSPAENTLIQKTSVVSVIPESLTAMLTLCGYVIFFSVILGLFEHIKIISALQNFLMLFHVKKQDAALMAKGIFEITAAVFQTPGASLPCISALISLGGISVFFQSLSFCRQASLSIKPYIFGKFLCGGFSALYTYISLKLFPINTAVFSALSPGKIEAYSFYFFAFSLFCALFLVALMLFSKLPQGGKSVCPEKQNSTRILS